MTKISWAGTTLAGDVALEATALRHSVHGRDRVLAVMGAANDYYASVDFTQRSVSGPRTYLEWVATGPTGTKMAGVTVLTSNDAGEIEHVAIHHRPLDAALEFAAAMAEHFPES